MMMDLISILCAGLLIGFSLGRMLYDEENSSSSYIFLICGVILAIMNIGLAGK